MKKIAITLGDPNSISPEIIIKALNKLDLPQEKIVLIGSKNVFDYYEKHFALSFAKKYEIAEVPYAENDIKIGSETKEAGEFSFEAIKKACELVNSGQVEAIATGPVSKNAMNMAGHHYAGQTEIIEKYIAKNGQKAEMLFVCGDIKLLLLTRHVAVSKLSDILKKDYIVKKVSSVSEDLTRHFRVQNPKFALCSLNPHAGENGLFGDEEIKEYLPAVKELQSKGVQITKPLPADGVLAKLDMNKAPEYDCYLASYHDQGLVAIKLLGMNKTVNTTIGLDVLRTSPAHGTAFDIAGKIVADEESMISAIKLAIKD
ncbi:MAG: 4-hydroxythreonine-4-phosphate dehydrogenase PdxA [Candidatus Gastranaerophilales bacterium]|nr:4-hydroxythreonine-4-phosphate dehydrogenase PdxA [Candidatus Gastranaerophilales bacterium]